MPEIAVAPLAGARIEIAVAAVLHRASKSSLPSRERGLKLTMHLGTPLPHKSLPSRERGLKSSAHGNVGLGAKVAPLAGARIEMILDAI